ncbi:unnamed protein product [Phaeothamnion confervicola]
MALPVSFARCSTVCKRPLRTAVANRAGFGESCREVLLWFLWPMMLVPVAMMGETSSRCFTRWTFLLTFPFNPIASGGRYFLFFGCCDAANPVRWRCTKRASRRCEPTASPSCGRSTSGSAAPLASRAAPPAATCCAACRWRPCRRDRIRRVAAAQGAAERWQRLQRLRRQEERERRRQHWLKGAGRASAAALGLGRGFTSLPAGTDSMDSAWCWGRRTGHRPEEALSPGHAGQWWTAPPALGAGDSGGARDTKRRKIKRLARHRKEVGQENYC